MNLANGLILMCVIVSLGTIALVGFALWILSNDENADQLNCLMTFARIFTLAVNAKYCGITLRHDCASYRDDHPSDVYSRK